MEGAQIFKEAGDAGRFQNAAHSLCPRLECSERSHSEKMTSARDPVLDQNQTCPHERWPLLLRPPWQFVLETCPRPGLLDFGVKPNPANAPRALAVEVQVVPGENPSRADRKRDDFRLPKNAVLPDAPS